MIVRTAAEGASEEELTKDVERLTARWSDIEQQGREGQRPQLLYGEPDLTLKVVRDLFTEDFAKLVDGERRYLDPHLATSAIDQALKQIEVEPGEQNLRRRCSIVLRSAAIRNVHDVVLALGLGANGVCPYVMVEVVCVDDYDDRRRQPLRGAAQGNREGDLDDRDPRGARLRAPVLLDRHQARAGRDLPDPGLRRLREGRRRLRPARRRHRRRATRSSAATRRRSRRRRSASTPRSTRRRSPPPTAPRATRSTRRRCASSRPRARSRCATSWALKGDREPDRPRRGGRLGRPPRLPDRDLLDELRLAVRARLPRLRRGGEGDQHPLHQRRGRGDPATCTASYRKWRGQQVASGRFGVSAEMLNSSYVAEIKIGQGAKPGEGGHLPGKKVSEKVAAARNASPGTDLISPSNNHDLYSIEDLAELIDELKTVNPDVRVSVKVPVVPNVGTIGLGIAKAGADIITLSGFEGGTGAARQHALRHVGLPSRHRHPRRAPGADGGRDPQPRRDLGRRRLPPRPRHRQAALHGRQPGRLRHPGDGLARLHDLPRLPARHLPRRHRDPDRDRRAGAGARAEEVHPAGGRLRRRELRPLLPVDGRGGQGRSSPRSATTAPRTWSAATTCSSRSPTRADRPRRR